MIKPAPAATEVKKEAQKSPQGSLSPSANKSQEVTTTGGGKSKYGFGAKKNVFNPFAKMSGNKGSSH